MAVAVADLIPIHPMRTSPSPQLTVDVGGDGGCRYGARPSPTNSDHYFLAGSLRLFLLAASPAVDGDDKAARLHSTTVPPLVDCCLDRPCRQSCSFVLTDLEKGEGRNQREEVRATPIGAALPSPVPLRCRSIPMTCRRSIARAALCVATVAIIILFL
ncbi:hypothetical protein E2562_024091 [Oryza meyeriana var. granulata]|uniref:Uncharacterized protein n=1 Tax=Oryza meyeriana var. granulata TaxID=110450 RepID=A0A6G1CI09_9ORYZ|nr:hypothetical protein E2562_024091 [Oryza meyeriana var. granulata]KAF0899771.1 hypothetical protein E2562_024091 [Oryza meyeriana var. granulata]